MSADRDELRRLVDEVPESEVPALLAEARRHLTVVGDKPWPPAFFGAGRSSRTDFSVVQPRHVPAFSLLPSQ